MLVCFDTCFKCTFFKSNSVISSVRQPPACDLSLDLISISKGNWAISGRRKRPLVHEGFLQETSPAMLHCLKISWNLPTCTFTTVCAGWNGPKYTSNGNSGSSLHFQTQIIRTLLTERVTAVLDVMISTKCDHTLRVRAPHLLNILFSQGSVHG